jgi:hypothetical protein
MIAKIINVPGTEKYPFACIIDLENYFTDRISDENKAKKCLSFIENCDDINTVRSVLMRNCIELKMKK